MAERGLWAVLRTLGLHRGGSARWPRSERDHVNGPVLGHRRARIASAMVIGFAEGRLSSASDGSAPNWSSTRRRSAMSAHRALRQLGDRHERLAKPGFEPVPDRHLRRGFAVRRVGPTGTACCMFRRRHKARPFAESGRSRSNSTVSPTGNSWTGHLDLSPARTNPGFCETQDSRCTRGIGLVSATQESTLALKTGPLLSRGSNRLHDS